ncbi:MAG TPA: CYTH and CHAD domain-containing protein [Gaiella sp.]|jgi:CHAD domain-containing protein
MTELRETIEREVKLSPGKRFAMPALGGESIVSRVFVSTYHDTPDHRLARSGLTLRYRVENGRGRWQLKLPSGDARRELEADGPGRTAPASIAGLLPALVRGRKLVPVARLRTRRDGLRVNGAEVVHDVVSVLEGQRVSRTFDELEVELIEGDERTLRRLEKALRRAGALDGEARPKLFRALDLADPADLDEPGVDGSATDRLAAAFGTQYRRLLAHDPGTRLGVDPESLHQLRVATRRSRAFLRAGRPLLDPVWADDLRAELGWLGGVLGPVRDLDVLIDRLQGESSDLEADAADWKAILGALRRERTAARRRLVRALGSARYFAVLDRVEAAGDPPLADPLPDLSLEAIWHREQSTLKRAVARLGDAPLDDDLHAVRIKVKRARYAAELAGLEPYVRAAKALQDALGEHQDSVVAEMRLRSVAAARPETAVAAGRVVERERQRRARVGTSWRKQWRQLAKEAKRV